MNAPLTWDTVIAALFAMWPVLAIVFVVAAVALYEAFR